VKIKVDPAKVEQLAGEGLAQYQIAQALGMSWNTFQSRRDEDAEVFEALKRGQQAAIGKVENALYESAIKGNLGAQVFFLKNRAADRWKDKTEQVRTVQAAAAADLTDDELAEAVKG
jgi:hypothetical protein